MIFIEPVIAELRPGPEWTVDGCILGSFIRPAGEPDSIFFAKLDIFAGPAHSSITSPYVKLF